MREFNSGFSCLKFSFMSALISDVQFGELSVFFWSQCTAVQLVGSRQQVEVCGWIVN